MKTQKDILGAAVANSTDQISEIVQLAMYDVFANLGSTSQMKENAKNITIGVMRFFEHAIEDENALSELSSQELSKEVLQKAQSYIKNEVLKNFSEEQKSIDAKAFDTVIEDISEVIFSSYRQISGNDSSATISSRRSVDSGSAKGSKGNLNY